MGWLWHDNGSKGTIILWVCRMYLKIFCEPCLPQDYKCRSISKLLLFVWYLKSTHSSKDLSTYWKNILDALNFDDRKKRSRKISIFALEELLFLPWFIKGFQCLGVTTSLVLAYTHDMGPFFHLYSIATALKGAHRKTLASYFTRIFFSLRKGKL